MQLNLGRTIGLDVHRDRIFVTILSPMDGKADQYEISTAEKDLAAFLLTLRPDDQVALEATRGHGYYVDRLQSVVGRVAVANPTKLQFFTGKNAKNDRNDSFSLAMLLAVGTLPTVWVPDSETRQDREVLHYRANLIQEQTRLKNRIRALLAEHGMSWPGSDIAADGARLFLLKLKSRLPWATSEILVNQLEQLGLLQARLRQTENLIEVRAARWPEVALLMTIRGINVLTAFTIMAIVGRVDRFQTADSLANYAGLVPRQRSSAGKSHLGKVTKAGSRMLRWALTEAVQCLCRVDGPYRNLCKRLERKKKSKGVAMTACARKLLKAIWCMLSRGETFHHAEESLIARKLKRRGQRLTAASAVVDERKKRAGEVILRQLATVQGLAQRQTQLPVPRQLLASFGRHVPDDFASTR
jgi:transposase